MARRDEVDRTPVTVIGLGRMGAALAETFLDHGHPTTVWNRSAAKAEALVAKGAKRTDGVAEAVAASPVAVVCLSDNQAVRATLEAAVAALAGRTVLNLSTGRPDEARALSGWVTPLGAEYLDGGILGVPQTVATPDTVIIYSGSARAHETYGALVAGLGTATYLGADPGLAALNDMAVLSGMYGLFAGFFQAVAMVGTEGTSAREFTASLLVPWLTALMEALPMLADEIDSGEYPVTFSDLAGNHHGLANILTTSEHQGVSPELLAPLQALFDRQLAAGNGASSFSRVVEEIGRRGESG